MKSTFDELAYLTHHSATLEEVLVLADWAARVVTVVRETGGLLPPVLCRLVDEVADRPSVRRVLNTQAADSVIQRNRETVNGNHERSEFDQQR